jgi:uncharacterized protein
MDITPLVPKSRQVITGYGNGGFKLNHQFTQGSLLLFPEHSQPWNVTDINKLTLEDLAPVLNAQGVELLLIGTGASMIPFAPAIRQAFRVKSIAVDVMDTGAACRTYNVLLAEERRVAAALIAV